MQGPLATPAVPGESGGPAWVVRDGKPMIVGVLVITINYMDYGDGEYLPSFGIAPLWER